MLEALLEISASLTPDLDTELISLSAGDDAASATFSVRSRVTSRLAALRRARLDIVIGRRTATRMARSTERLLAVARNRDRLREIDARQEPIRAALAAYQGLVLERGARVPAGGVDA